MSTRPKVLVIDDNQAQLAVVAAWLRHDGFEVVEKDSPIGTSQAFQREKPGVVLIDIHMPALAGTALANMLARDARANNAVIVFYSSTDPARLSDLPRTSPILGAIHKTESRAKFLSQLHGLLDSRIDAAPEPSSRQSIVVVDDDEVQLAVLRAWLESAGFEVITHASPIGVTSIINRVKPAVILIDVEMPILSGPALVQIIEKNVRHKVDIVFYSGKDRVELDGLIRINPALVRGAIRKTNNGPLFLRQLQQLLSARGAPAS